jgi:catechol 2,3-dioxygenase-like lactoylglutathione lyase family enzyme
MVRVTGIDHLVLNVGDFKASKAFYGPLMAFLGFKLEAEYEDMMGWHNDKTLFWIAAADAKGRTHKYRKGDIGFHHYAFRLRSRKDVDALQSFLEKQGATIVDPAGEYYDDYYAVFFPIPTAWAEHAASATNGATSAPGKEVRPQVAIRREKAGKARGPAVRLRLASSRPSGVGARARPVPRNLCAILEPVSILRRAGRSCPTSEDLLDVLIGFRNGAAGRARARGSGPCRPSDGRLRAG